MDDAETTLSGSAFQISASATGKARLVDRLNDETVSWLSTITWFLRRDQSFQLNSTQLPAELSWAELS